MSNKCVRFKWANFNNQLCTVFYNLWKSNSLLDVTIAVEGHSIEAHRIILCACSDYFKRLLVDFNDDHPVIILSHMSFENVSQIINFMYVGELSTSVDEIQPILDVAKELKVYGLMDLEKHKEVIDVVTNCTTEASDVIPLPLTTPQGNNDNTQNPEYSATDIMPFIEVSTINNITDVLENHNNQSECHKQVLFTIPNNKNPPLQMATVVEEIDHKIHDENLNLEPSNFAVVESGSEVPLSKDKHYYNEENFNGSENRKPTKMYDPNKLQKAFEQLRAGQTFSNVASAYNIPRSSLYFKARENRILSGRKYERSEENTTKAIDSVIKRGCTFGQAASKFNLSKTVLWRKVRKHCRESCKEDIKAKPNNSLINRAEAIKALENGETITSVSISYKIPKSTLFREKAKLVECGKLPKESVRKRCEDDKIRLEKAIKACKDSKLSQSSAAALFNVSKTTIWRHMQNKNQMNFINTYKMQDCVSQEEQISNSNIEYSDYQLVLDTKT